MRALCIPLPSGTFRSRASKSDTNATAPGESGPPHGPGPYPDRPAPHNTAERLPEFGRKPALRQAASRARARSAARSSGCSSPTERRTSPSGMPMRRRSAGTKR